MLNETMQHALRSVNSLDEVKQYGLKGLNMVTVRPDNSINSSDSQFIFTLDSSKLSGNIPLNRIEMEAQIRVTATGSIKANGSQGYQGAPLYGIGPAKEGRPYLMSASSGGLDSFVLNKMFSNVTLSDKQVQFVQESRDPQKIEILSRFFEQENLEQSGIYLEDTYGGFDLKAGGSTELLSIVDPANARQEFLRGCDADSVLDRNRFWKQNTNNQYINLVDGSNKFFNGTTLVADGALVEPYVSLNKDGKAYFFSSGTATSQVQDFIVKEDLCHDILVTKYQKKPIHAGIPTTDMVFTFTKSTLIDTLYKISDTSFITDIKVEIIDLKLKVLTFNYGLLSAIPVDRPYYIPFFSEQVNQETIILSGTFPTNDRQTQTRQYNSVPQYIAIWCQEPSSTSGTNSNLTNSITPAKVTRLSLQIDNDVQTPLYNLSIEELKFRTLTNLADCDWNVNAMLRNMPQETVGSQAWFPTGTVPNFATLNQLVGRCAITADRSFLDGFFLLKLDKDIRLPANLCVGMDTKISFTWTPSFDTLSNEPYMNGATTAIFYTYAFFPSMYKVSAEKGLLKAQKLVIGSGEFEDMINNTNAMIRGPSYSNSHSFNSQNPILIGSGFGQIWEQAQRHMPMAKRVIHHASKIASEIADKFDGPVAKNVKEVAKVIADLTKAESKAKKAGRKAKMLR